MRPPPLAALALLIFLTSCGGPAYQRLYSPPFRPVHGIARLGIDWSAPFHATAVDGKPTPGNFFKPGLVDVLPGTHRVTVRTNAGGTMETSWDAKAGEFYQLGAERVGYSGAFDTYIKAKPVFVPGPPIVKRKLEKMFP